MVAKLGLMITHLGRKQEVLALRGFEFTKELKIPARNSLPESENSIPSVAQYDNNRIILQENQGVVAQADI